jgi:hypothetical protein
MGFYKTTKKLNLENEVEEVIIEEPATIEDVVDRDITNSEFQETSKDLEDAIETSDELESVGTEVQEELDAVNERLESEEPIDPVDVTVVNESIQHYSKLLGLTRESINLSLEDVRNNTRESMEGLKIELEGIGAKIKEYTKKAWDKIVELFKKLMDFLFDIRKFLSRKIQNILTNGLEIPDKEFELTHKERVVLTFGFKYLIDTYTKTIEVLSQATGKAGEKLLKVDTNIPAEQADAIANEAHDILLNTAKQLKPDDNNPNINMKLLLRNMKNTFPGEIVLAVLPYNSNEQTGSVAAIAITIISKTGTTGFVESTNVNFDDVKAIQEFSVLVDKVYRDKDYLTKEVNTLKSLKDWNKTYLDNLFKLGTLIAKRQDDHMSWSSYENINRQSAMYYGTLEHCKKVIKTVLLLGKHYISTVDCFVKYIDKHFTKHSDSTTVAQS